MGRRSATGRWAVEQTKSVAWRMRDLLPEALGEVRSLGSGHLIEREREPVLVGGDRQEPAIRDEPLDVLEDRLAHSGDQRLFLAQEQKVGENAGFTLECERLRIPAVVAAVVEITEQIGKA